MYLNFDERNGLAKKIGFKVSFLIIAYCYEKNIIILGEWAQKEGRKEGMWLINIERKVLKR